MNIRCFDHPDYVDRYTVVYLDQPEGNGLYACVGMSGAPFHPQGFCQHSTCRLGKHLGKRITFSNLPADCQALVKQDLV